MYINIGKTSVVTIGSRLKLSHTESIRIFLHNELVKEVDNQKLLGVIIDKTLTWDKQIDAVCTEASMDPRNVEITSARPSYFLLTCLGIPRHDD